MKGRNDNNTEVDKKLWEMFEKSGNTGFYMLYNALKNTSKDE